MIKLAQIDASFRDRAGYVYEYKDTIIRSVSEFGKNDFELYEASGLRSLCQKQNLVIPFIENAKVHIPHAWKVLEVRRLPFISYPYEWTFEMFKDAALLTLTLARSSLLHDMSLKDASAYNVQFYNGKPVWIDILSFEKYKHGEPWVAYGQFCRHYLAPLVLMAKTNIDLSRLGQLWIDGIPLDIAASMLPWWCRFDPRMYIHIYLHTKLQTKSIKVNNSNTPEVSNVSKQTLLDLIQHLEDTIDMLTPNKRPTLWAEYSNHSSYSVQAVAEKKKIVNSIVKKMQPNTVLDIGANIGIYSTIAAAHANLVVAIDNDANALQDLSQFIKTTNIKNILPLNIDITNPSPAIGWQNRERVSFLSRARPDLILALAVLHHLVIGNNLSLEHVAHMLQDISGAVLIEFVPKNDAMVQKLMCGRESMFDQYSQEQFEKSFLQYFPNVERFVLPKSDRSLYLFRKI